MDGVFSEKLTFYPLISVLASNALKDACGLTNPRRATQEDIEGVFKAEL